MKIPHNRLTFSPEDADTVADVVRSGNWVGGEQLSIMEGRLCAAFGINHAVGVGSGVAALRLALLALNVGKGDEVIVPAYSCVALANAILSIGAIPIPVDVNLDEWNINVAEVESKISSRTKAVIAVNTFGLPADIEKIQALGLKVIEDCSHGYYPENNSLFGGIRGDVAVFSFYSSKLIAGGEGGAILTDDEHISKFVREWRDYTDKMPDGRRLNDKMTDIESTLVISQLNRLPDMISARARLAHHYCQELGKIKNVYTPQFSNTRIWYRYVIRLDNFDLSVIESEAFTLGISVARPVELWIDETVEGMDNARYAWTSLLSLPLYPTLSKKEHKYVCDVIKKLVA